MRPLYVRHRIDLDGAEVAFGLRALFSRQPWEDAATRTEQAWSTSGDTLACLSVRSGFDLYLSALNLPPGSEVLVSAISIPDMVHLLHAHKLVPVPIDLDIATLTPRLELLDRAVTSRTRALLVAHLFGGRFDVGPFVAWAKAHGLLLWEDAAQSVTGVGPSESAPGADVSMFSFGPLKTGTALGGGLFRVSDAVVLERMRRIHTTWPVQSTALFRKRLLLYGVLVFFQEPKRYRTFVTVATRGGRSIDDILRTLTRGFSATTPDELARALRVRPSVPLLTLLRRRVEHFDEGALKKRAASGEATQRAMGDDVEVAGADQAHRTHWLFACTQADPDRTRKALWEVGIHATGIPSNLFVVPPPPDRPEVRAKECLRFFERSVFTPVYPEIDDTARAHLARIFREGALIEKRETKRGEPRSARIEAASWM